jgi:hypothetical protein
MKIHFRLYNDNHLNYRSTIFDLISGAKEPKQTKGLAFILSHENSFLLKFIKLQLIQNKLKTKLNIRSITSVEISAEENSANKTRADIIIKIDQANQPYIAIIIEAKSIIANVDTNEIQKQIRGYLNKSSYPELNKYKNIGVVLSKYRLSLPGIVNLTWNDIVDLLYDFCKNNPNSTLINDYYNFITQINKNMNFYEEEVLSIPAGRTFSMVMHHQIYWCPDSKGHNHKKSLYVTFREPRGGTMRNLYKIEDVLVLNPSDNSQFNAFKASRYSAVLKKRIKNLINDKAHTSPMSGDLKFYILSQKDTIQLTNCPKPKLNTRKFMYYTLKDILTEKEVTPKSKK